MFQSFFFFGIFEEPIILVVILDPRGIDVAVFARYRWVIALDSLDHHVDEAIGMCPIRRSCTNIAWVDLVPALVRRSDLESILLNELALKMIFKPPLFSHSLTGKS